MAHVMTYEEIRMGLGRGRKLIQHYWADEAEIDAVNRLKDEGYALVSGWQESEDGKSLFRSVVIDREKHPLAGFRPNPTMYVTMDKNGVYYTSWSKEEHVAQMLSLDVDYSAIYELRQTIGAEK